MNRKNFENYYNEQVPSLLVYLTRITGISREDAEEVVQQTALDLWQKRETLGGIRNLTAWCYTLARNKAVDMIRKDRKRPELLSEKDTVDPALSQEEQLLRDEQRLFVSRFLEGLDPRDREITYLVYFEGLTVLQTAAVMNCPAGTIKFRRHDIRKRLAEKLRKEGWT